MARERPRLVLAGGTGLVGRWLIRELGRRWRVQLLTRRPDVDHLRTLPPWVEAYGWDPEHPDAGQRRRIIPLLGDAAVVNLAGHSVGAGRLGRRHHARVLGSRLAATRWLGELAAEAPTPPRVWINASAVGVYGDRGEEVLPETAAPGPTSAPLVAICTAWEGAAREAVPATTRLVLARLGVVLAPEAPAWRRLVAPVRLGLGGPLGDGRQWLAWISAADAAAALRFLLEEERAQGVVNVVAPEPVRQGQLVVALARSLGRPAVLRTPAWALRLLLGRAADALVLASTRVVPERLAEWGFRWRHPDLATVLPWLLEAAAPQPGRGR